MIAKGVQEISHQQCDGYYKCLLNMPSQLLGALLDQARDQSNAWFEGKLKEHSCASGEGDGGRGSVALPLDCGV